jgi:predicted Zn-dependent protease
MTQSRIDIFAEMVKQQPDDAMIWYGLANEYVKTENWEQATDALLNVVRLNPDFTSAYQLLGTAKLNQGQHEEARRAWTDGISVADRTGAWKARQHMEGLLKGIGRTSSDSGFCD